MLRGRGVRRLAPLLLVAGLLLIYLPTGSRFFVATDVGANTLTAWQLAHTGQPWMEELDLPEPHDVIFYAEGRDGHTVTFRTPGQIWAAVPFYFFTSPEQTGYSFGPGAMAAALMTAAAMAMLFAATRRAVGDRLAAAGALTVALTTPVWSVAADALWTHPATILGIAGAAWAASRERWWLAGAFLGFGMLARLHLAVIAATLGIVVSLRRRDPMPALKVGIPTLASLGVLSLWSFWVFDTWDPRGAYTSHDYASVVPGGGHIPFWENLGGFFFAADRGWLVWTPALFLLIPAVLRSLRGVPAWSAALALGGLLYLVAQVGLNWYDGGSSFWGYRLALEPLLCLMPLLILSVRATGRWARRLLPWVTGLQFSAVSLGAIWMPLEFMTLKNERWARNSYLWALADHPAVVGGYSVVVGAAWVAAWYFFSRWRTTSARLPAPQQ